MKSLQKIFSTPIRQVVTKNGAHTTIGWETVQVPPYQRKQDFVAQVPLHQRKKVFVDIETTGLSLRENGEIDYDMHEILEIAIVAEDGTVLLNTKIKPIHIGTANERALAINGYNSYDWAKAPLLKDVAPEIVKHLTDVIIVGHNVGTFDYPRIKHWCSKYTKTQRMSFHMIDTMSLVAEHLVPLGCKSMALKKACEFVGIEYKDGHRALVDAEACRKLHGTLLSASKLSKLWWRLKNRGS